MTEKELNDHQLNLAKVLAKGKVVSPCVAAKYENGITKPNICEYLDIENGCQKDNGFVLNPNESISCPDGKGRIIIHTDSIIELIPNKVELLPSKQSDYALEIAKMNIDGGLAKTAEERSMLFV